MTMNTSRTLHRAPILRLALGALAPLGIVPLGLALLGFSAVARADDVKVQPAPGSGLVVTDTTGALQRFKVLETGEVFLGGLLVSHPVQSQPLCYNPGSGQVGDCVVAPAPAGPRFIDSGDGTVTDTKTGLMWEKKTTDDSVHDVTKTFTWSTGTNDFDGTAKTAFLDVLNDVAGGGAHCFAGYCDWRLPNEDGQNPPGTGPKELETILDLTQGNCGGGTGPCVVPALSPTRSNVYWSATTNAGDPNFAWASHFGNGSVNIGNKTIPFYVRAVRSGL